MPTRNVLWHRYQRWLYLFFKLLLGAAALIGVLWLLSRVSGVVIPVVFAFFIAYQMNPFVDWAESKGIPRPATTVASLLVVVAGFVVFLALFIPRFVGEFGSLVAQLPTYVQNLYDWAVPWLRENVGIEVEIDLATIKAQLQEHGASLLQPTGAIIGTVASGVLGLLSALLGLLLVPVFIYFLCVDYHRIIAAMGGLVPPRHREIVSRVTAKIDRAMSSFVRGQITVMLFLMVFYSIGLTILGVKFAIFIGVIAGIANIVPYVGPAIGAGLSALMTLLEWTGFGSLVGVLGLFVVGNLLESFVLTPKIVGDRVGLSPLLVLVSLLFWGELLGIMGVLIAIPVTAILRIVLAEVFAAYRKSDYFQRAGGD